MAKASNPNLKRANEEHEYTHHQIQELKKSSEDPVYFINKYCKIQHPIKGAIPFKLHPVQEEMVRAYHEHRQVVVLASRQVGKCNLFDTKLSVINVDLSNINTFKKVILWIFNRSVYDGIFKKL